MGRYPQWVVYIDEKTDKVCAIEDDHLGVKEMVENRPGWRVLGHVAMKDMTGAIAYGNQVFAVTVPAKPKKIRRK